MYRTDRKIVAPLSIDTSLNFYRKLFCAETKNKLVDFDSGKSQVKHFGQIDGELYNQFGKLLLQCIESKHIERDGRERERGSVRGRERRIKCRK